MLRTALLGNKLMIHRSLLLVLLAVQGQQTTFEFHSSFWVNLHHTLYHHAFLAKNGISVNLSALSPSEAATWNEAVQYYGQNLITHDFLEAAMGRINTILARADNASTLGAPPELSKELAGILEKAAPVYRARWWPNHDRRNQEWIAAATPLVGKHEAVLKATLSRALDTQWQKSPIPVEMSYYVSNSAAYTAIFPTLITASSSSQRNVGPAMLEMLFHESGHALIVKARDELAKEAKSRKKEMPYTDLWHGLLFYTNSEIVKKQIPELEPYAEKYGFWQNNWPLALPVFEKDWKPVLEGKAHFRDALKQIVADLAK
jgi:hypothetical protein